MESLAGFEWPAVDVVVATFNEERLIAGKLRELDEIAYPAEKLHVAVVDGGSSDDTADVIAAHATRSSRLLPVFSATASKPAQLNEALACTRAPWVLVTDADARVPADTLQRLVEVAARDATIGVVGTRVVPHDPHPLDHCHWRISNWIRSVERRVGGASGLAVAPCYLFRRDLLDRFPDDVVADDVYVVCRAAHQGARTELVEIDVTELRVPDTTLCWFRHKLRRTLGYLHEIIRFGPSLMRMAAPMRSLLLWRAAALTVAPVAGLVGGAVLAWGIGPWPAAAMLLGAGAGVLAPTFKPPTRLRVAIAATTLPLWILCIMTSALLMYPFVRQSGSYSRWSLKAEEPETCS